jgi:hypothetical protein
MLCAAVISARNLMRAPHRAQCSTSIANARRDCAEQFAVTSKTRTQFERHGEDKLSERHSRQNVVHQIRRRPIDEDARHRAE